MLPHLIYRDTLKFTSLPESVDGATLCDSQDGPILAQLGLALAPANLSARQAKAAGLLMSGIYGPLPTGLSRSADLSQSWASRLRAKTDSLGSTLFRLTWKIRLTPAGRSISALRGSVLRTSVNGCIGVPTPCSQDGPNGGPSQGTDRLPGTVSLASVGTPRDVKEGHSSGNPNRAMNHKSRLEDQVHLSTVPTPSSRDWKDTPGMAESSGDRSRLDQLPRQAQLAVIGPPPIGGTGETTNTGPLNPEYSRWLQGYPVEWGSCADTAIRLSHHLRQSSSKRRKGGK